VILHAFVVDEAVRLIQDRLPDVVHLDYDLDLTFPGVYVESRHSGMVAARALVAMKDYWPKVIIHSWNPAGGRAMYDLLTAEGFTVHYQPWSWPHDPNKAFDVLAKAFPEKTSIQLRAMIQRDYLRR
jgi:hypothetical protein